MPLRLTIAILVSVLLGSVSIAALRRRAATAGRAGPAGPPGRRHDDPGRRSRPRRRRRARRASARSCSPTPTRTSTSRGRATSRRSPAQRVVLRSGGDLDDWLDDVSRNAGSDARAVDAHRRAAPGRGAKAPPTRTGGRIRATRSSPVLRIRDALIDADAGGRARRTRPTPPRTSRKLRALDRAIAGCIGRSRRARRKLVTDHDALGSYAARYGIQVIGTVIPARSTQAQASAGEISRLVRTIRADRRHHDLPRELRRHEAHPRDGARRRR